MPVTNNEKEKVIMGYKLKFKTEYDEADTNGEYIKLTVEVSDELREILKKSTIREATNERFLISSVDTTKIVEIVRYKVKTVVNNVLNQIARDVVFSKDVIDNGSISINILDVNRVLTVIERVKDGVRGLLETVIGISNLSQEVSYNIIEE